MIIGIYEIENLVNNKFYIGSTTNFKKRFSSHRSQLNRNKHINKQLQRDWLEFGEENFKFTIVKEVLEEKNLPNEEYLQMEFRKKKSEIYNVSNPLEEVIAGRFEHKNKNVKMPKKLKVHKYKTKKEAITYLNECFKDKMEILLENAEDRIYYQKEKVDDWFLKNIKDKDFLDDERVIMFLNAWYNKNGFSIIDPRMYKSLISKLFKRDCGTEGHILVTHETNRILYNAKFMKRKF